MPPAGFNPVISIAERFKTVHTAGGHDHQDKRSVAENLAELPLG
jgi:hypothetical protein